MLKFIVGLFVGLIAACAYMLWYRQQMKHILQKMDEMLEQAIRGDFTEQDLDESMLSSVETKLAHYLSASEVSARSLNEERDKIRTLIADISHQTKTPIANILLYTQLLEEQTLTTEGRTCVDALDTQAQKLQALIDALVKISRLETGVLTLHPKPSPLAPILEEAVNAFGPRAAAKDIALQLDFTGESAVCDPKWTMEAVGNLIDNAIKYTPAGGTVHIRVLPYEIFCRINVEDTGIGIPEAEQAKIFGRFYRSENAYESEGVGIGLYLVRQIAAGQGGYVKVSGAPGKGSVFSLFLPRN